MPLRPLAYAPHPEIMAENGPATVHPDDRKYGVLAAGVQGVGKTALLLRMFANDLKDGNAAQVVIDPKPELVQHCLEIIPPDHPKEVWYLDLGDPAFGMTLLRMYPEVDFATECAAVADSFVAAVLAIDEGQFSKSSRRYLYHAVIGALAIARLDPGVQHAPLEHVYALLLPRDEEMRQGAAIACQHLGLTQTGYFFARELPDELQIAGQETAKRLDPPRNKVAGLLGVPSLERFFEHPHQVSVSEIIERRGILLVNANRAAVGEENIGIIMNVLFQLLHRHMQRQSLLPDEHRPRVATIVDEAHYLFSRTVVKSLATHRFAGMDMAASIQYLAQLGADAGSASITREIRDGVVNLLQSKFLFRISDPRDADESSRIAMAFVSTMTQQDPDSRVQRRITPEVMMNIENHYCVVSGIVAGSRSSAFIGRTYPMQKVTRTWADQHLEAMRERLGPAPPPGPKPGLELAM